MLKSHQKRAIQASIDNNFTSGVHFHATGTGKSWVAKQLLLEYHFRYPLNNIIWLCEHQDILLQQFNTKTLADTGFQEILDQFHVLKIFQNKNKNWITTINSAKFWTKPALIIINRPFLTSLDKYRKINLPIHLIIHDECHTQSNESTSRFYEYMLQRNEKISCIGFSATPSPLSKPFDKIISAYSIYDAFMDGAIVPPKILWINEKMSIIEMAKFVKYCMNSMFYKKIIVWCGMIDHSIQLSEKWSPYFPQYIIAYDTSTRQRNVKEFLQADKEAILFCASKHREGSDIKHLDTCIFMDGVSHRNANTFTQCIGRVLRKKERKQYGLIIDFKIASVAKVFFRLNRYLDTKDCFPWEYETFNLALKEKKFIMHSLFMVMQKQIMISHACLDCDIFSLFVRKIPEDGRYHERLHHELEMIEAKQLKPYLLQALYILKMTKNIPHITRGSCGSSLLCYMLGISHVDPVMYDIKFARFLNEFRDTLPDIDFDFPYNKRDEVFFRLEINNPGKVARISNHVYYHEKSALRQAIRNHGIHKFIAKENMQWELSHLSFDTRMSILSECKQLEDSFRCFSLHCGGIVFYPDGIPDGLVINKNGILAQIHSDKHAVAKEKIFKIDILSSRGLAQLHRDSSISFEDCPYDASVYELLCRGDNIGLTFAESPLMRKCFINVQPKSISDIALCLALIRPAAKDARMMVRGAIVYDDDAIEIISQALQCTDAHADFMRRKICKKDPETVELFKCHHPEAWKRLKNLSKYGFCKSHAFSYAQLVYKLASMKCHDPKQFWTNTIRHCHSSFRKWVHLYEARLADVINEKESSIFAKNRDKKSMGMSPFSQLYKYGSWDMTKSRAFFPDCFLELDDSMECRFNGIIASHRMISKGAKGQKTFTIFLGVGKRLYIEVEFTTLMTINIGRFIGVMGDGIMTDTRLRTISAHHVSFF
jgi:hypothetical protein